MSTDNKTAKKQFADRFGTFADETLLKQSLLRYEQEAEFSVSDYLKKKALFILSRADEESTGAGSGHKRKSAAKEPKEPKAPKTPTRQITLDLFKEGMNVQQIATARGLAQSTIITHCHIMCVSERLVSGLSSLRVAKRRFVTLCRLILK